MFGQRTLPNIVQNILKRNITLNIFLPTIYKNYDLTCKFFLDSAYTNNSTFITTLKNHIDILKGKDAENFKQDVGGALMLRLERLRVTIKAYEIAKDNCNNLKKLLDKYLGVGK